MRRNSLTLLSCAGAAILFLGTSACSSTGGAPSDAGQATDGGDASSAVDAPPDLMTAMKCTGINLSCYNPTPASGVPICFEYANADDAKVAEVTTFCDGMPGTLAHAPCPSGYSAGCVARDATSCQNTWYWFPPDLLSQVCGANLILP